ncbi:MAG: SH3 domain-containing protein [Gammaproteobacteria bacterium]|jgi:hypothetical protein
MEQARQRIEEIKQLQREKMQGSRRTTAEAGAAHDRPQYLVALGGVAVGLLIATVIGLTKPLVTGDNSNSVRAEAADVMSPEEIRKTNDNIARLNQRMELLADTVSRMDARFERILVMADAVNQANNKDVPASQKTSSDPAAETAEFADAGSATSSEEDTAPATEQAFVPTHTVKARINLRPSTSLNTTPIAVLNAGTEVEYISETGGWYYVNTRLHGKGWCASDYLSPLQPAKQDAT